VVFDLIVDIAELGVPVGVLGAFEGLAGALQAVPARAQDRRPANDTVTSYAHRNAACRGEREKALALYESLSKEEREKVPQVLRVWLRYRSEKYFGADRTPPRGRGR